MSRISNIFRKGNRKALIAYITVGYPDVDATINTACTLAKNGCDIIELGIPFSDPLADGVAIQNAAYRALQQGVTPKICLDVAARIHRDIDIPLVFMTYYNPVLSYNPDNFCRDCRNAGIDGLIVPDLPPDEGAELEELTRINGIDLVYLLSPASTGERMKVVAERSRGFIYLVSVAGVTGTRNSLPADLESFVARVRQVTGTPLCVGFGISTPEQATRVGAVADGVIVGSRFIQLLEAADGLIRIKDFALELRKALDSP